MPDELPRVAEDEVSVVTQKRKPVRRFLKSFVDVKKWSSYDEVSNNVKTTANLFKRLLFRGQNIRYNETYEEAVKRLNLTPEQLALREKNFLQSALVYGVFTLGFLVYLVYLLIHLRLLASVLMLILMVLMVLTTYREHFWYMQMHRKKLGCNFQEWLNFILGRKDS